MNTKVRDSDVKQFTLECAPQSSTELLTKQIKINATQQSCHTSAPKEFWIAYGDCHTDLDFNHFLGFRNPKKATKHHCNLVEAIPCSSHNLNNYEIIVLAT